QVPRVARCTLNGELQPGVVGKDVIIALCGLFNDDEVLNHAVEFTGEGVDAMTIDHRLSIANMTTEWGALAGLFPFDETLRDYLYERAEYLAAGRRPGERPEPTRAFFTRDDVDAWWDERLFADPDAHYAVDLQLDLSTVTPHVSGPNHVKVMTSMAEMHKRDVRIDKAYLVSCVNARLADLREAARVVRGRRVADHVKFYVAAASADIQAQAERDGSWQSLLDAGAIPLPSGCGPCIGLGTGLVEQGEVAISATNRNFKGRMGSRDAEVYLASPAVVAASAVAGRITAPGVPTDTKLIGRAVRRAEPSRTLDAAHADILEGFPTSIRGRTLYLRQDNLNTDGIYAGRWTYKDDLTHEQIAAVTFENYDPRFNEVYKAGDIIVSGRNFGTGSSREQAATALKYKGVPCVIAASFSETYRRNAFNNGFLCVECPTFVGWLDSRLSGTPGEAAPTIVGPEIEVDFTASLVRCAGESFTFVPLSTVAQELIVAGGAEAMVRRRLAPGM
ncbi:MAG: homoaconitase, partial [Planctomycetes bacterium]|nr:homoaconitase [Planctomycetota bacterium]